MIKTKPSGEKQAFNETRASFGKHGSVSTKGAGLAVCLSGLHEHRTVITSIIQHRKGAVEHSLSILQNI